MVRDASPQVEEAVCLVALAKANAERSSDDVGRAVLAMDGVAASTEYTQTLFPA